MSASNRSPAGRGFVFLACLLVAAVFPAPAFPVPSMGLNEVGDAKDIGHAELVVDLPRGGPFPLEMLKLHIRSTIHGYVALEDLQQPALIDLNWKQLGPDQWSYIQEKGLRVSAFERAMAIYPQHPGRIAIEPFVHHVTLVNTQGARVEYMLKTAPLTIDVLPLPKDAADWWLPARALIVTDDWDKRPDRLSLGETARRTLTIEAAGVGIEQLPPIPKMRAPGIISFAGPVERQSHITPDGPVSKAVYRWDVRPVSADASVLPPIQIPWFDTLARRSKLALIPERRISLAGADLRDEDTGKVLATPTFSPGSFSLAAAAAFLWGLASLWLWRLSGLGNEHPALHALRRAARRGDATAFRSRLVGLAPEIAGERDPTLQARLSALDAHLFGRSGQPAPPLWPLYRAVAAALKRTMPVKTGRRGRLLPIDGPA